MRRMLELPARAHGGSVLPQAPIYPELNRRYPPELLDTKVLRPRPVVPVGIRSSSAIGYLEWVYYTGQKVADVRLFQAYWRDQTLIPMEWRRLGGYAMPKLLFSGSVFVRLDDVHVFYYLCFHPGEDVWRWGLVRSYDRLTEDQFDILVRP